MMALTDEMKTSQIFQHNSLFNAAKHYLNETKILAQRARLSIREIKRKWANEDGDLKMMKKR